MARVDKLPAARADLIDIWQYIADDSRRDADRFLDRIEETLLLIAENPKMGRGREELAARLRSFPLGNYVIYYRPLAKGTGIEVVRVLQASQDIQQSRFE